jgi:alpha-beta hydrolase superfamily lysophospholipase
MSTTSTRRRFLPLTFLALLLSIGLPFGCSQLAHKERELVFNIEPGTASWFSGVPEGVQQFNIPVTTGISQTQYIHAWWWPAKRKNAPAVLYLHGTRWNLTAQVRRITALRNLGYSVLAIDYRGFGDSPGDLPSESTVYEDARIAWKRLMELQPDSSKRYIYGHSLGGAIAVNLAEQISGQKDKDSDLGAAAGLMIESTFTSLADAAAAVIDTSLPIRWLMSERFDSIDKIDQVDMPVLIAHGTSDQYVPPRFSEELFKKAQEPKRLLMIDGGNHTNSMSIGSQEYAQAVRELFGLKSAY